MQADVDHEASSPSATSGAFQASVGRLTDELGTALEAPEGSQRNTAIRSLLVQLHRDVMRAAAEAQEATPHALDDVAEVVRRLVPPGVENALTIRERVFVRLLRAGAVEPAWTLAEDSSSGVLPASRTGLKWAGGPETNVLLPLPTLVESGTVYAWLPGFRDPRWGLPDDAYDITTRVQLNVVLEQLVLERGRLKLGGAAHFTVLDARADDDVTVVLRGPAGQVHRTPAERARTHKYVKASSGPELTRLAWAGWHADIDLVAVVDSPGQWSVEVELARAGLRRDEPLGARRGAYARAVIGDGPTEWRGWVYRLESDDSGQLSLTTNRLGPSARLVPRPLRAALRRLRPRL